MEFEDNFDVGVYMTMDDRDSREGGEGKEGKNGRENEQNFIDVFEEEKRQVDDGYELMGQGVNLVAFPIQALMTDLFTNLQVQPADMTFQRFGWDKIQNPPNGDAW